MLPYFNLLKQLQYKDMHSMPKYSMSNTNISEGKSIHHDKKVQSLVTINTKELI